MNSPEAKLLATDCIEWARQDEVAAQGESTDLSTAKVPLLQEPLEVHVAMVLDFVLLARLGGEAAEAQESSRQGGADADRLLSVGCLVVEPEVQVLDDVEQETGCTREADYQRARRIK